MLHIIGILLNKYRYIDHFEVIKPLKDNFKEQNK